MSKGNPSNSVVPVTKALPLEDIAAKIRSEHEACRRDAHSAVEHALEAGKLLTQAQGPRRARRLGGLGSGQLPGDRRDCR
jgi:hypothetical protein